ncbi:MAG: potassium channel protein [Bacteroidota bacterium]
MRNQLLKQVFFGFIILTLIILLGTVLYMFIEEYSFIDALYMTIITISTTGFKEVRTLSDLGRLLTIFLILAGVLTIAYTGGRAAQLIIETQIFRRRRMSKQLDQLKDHYIVCGYGRMGREVCESLSKNKVPFMVIEKETAKIEQLIEKNILFIHGEAANDEVLEEAGIKRAKGLAAVVRSDAENVFITLSAKELNKDLFIVARAIEEGAESKLKRAGAHRVLKPYELGGKRLVQLLLRPGVIDFIEGVAMGGGVDIHLEEVSVESACDLVGKTLAESSLREELNIMVVGISKSNGQFIYNPRSSAIIEKGDKLIAIGETENLIKLNNMVMCD